MDQHPLAEIVVLHQAVREAHPVRPHGVATPIVVVGCKAHSTRLTEQPSGTLPVSVRQTLAMPVTQDQQLILMTCRLCA